MKVLIFGIPGSGKTHFANRLGAQMGIEVFHIDRHFFESGWIERLRGAHPHVRYTCARSASEMNQLFSSLIIKTRKR